MQESRGSVFMLQLGKYIGFAKVFVGQLLRNQFDHYCYSNLIAMKNILYRKQLQKEQNRPKIHKNFRYSLDASETSRPKAGCRQSYSRAGVQGRNKSRKDNRYEAGKLQNIETTKTSMNVTKSNSPARVQVEAKAGLQTISNYKFYYQIGLGAFGKVWRVVGRNGERDYALKEIAKARVCESSSAAVVLNERKILSRLDYPFLVNLQRAFQDSRKLYLLLDYLRGADLRYHICYRQRFAEQEIRFIAACLLLALEYTHSRKVIHKDVKPENIIFQENGYVRLTDFGIARMVSGKDEAQNESSGTPVYMAPEILFRSSYSYESDYYSLGVVLFELMMGHRPYSGKSRNEVREELVNKEICLAEFQKLHGYSMDLVNLINKLLKKNPSERLGRKGAHQIKQHAFFQSVKWRKLERKEVVPPFVPGVICEGQAYLKEIELFNEMNEEKKGNTVTVDTDKGEVFASYEFQREGVRKKLRKRGRGSIGRECDLIR